MSWDNFKGLRWYMVTVLMALSFFAYSQSIGWLWVGSTKTKPPADQVGGARGTHGGYRYLHHK
ncbi:MAG: hypothetical protein WDO14_07240 [Bacteroidota bacterium]